MTSPTFIHAVVLAGGEGRRMNRADKGLALFKDQALAQRAALRVQSSVGSVSISANRNLATYASFGFPIISDGSASFEGPLAGVLAALRVCPAPYLATLPCDVPYFPVDLFTRMAAKLETTQANVVMPMVKQADGNSFPDPVFMLMRRTVLPDLEAYFAAGGRKITTWAGKAGLALLPITDAQEAALFQDADTQQALSDLQSQALTLA